jgi:hypothetical protein
MRAAAAAYCFATPGCRLFYAVFAIAADFFSILPAIPVIIFDYHFDDYYHFAAGHFSPRHAAATPAPLPFAAVRHALPLMLPERDYCLLRLPIADSTIARC